MTGLQVILEIKLAIDKYAASDAAVIGPAFLDEELIAFANQAAIAVVCNKFTGNNAIRQGFEQTVKRVADLQKLITDAVLLVKHTYKNMYLSDELPSDCMFLVQILFRNTSNGDQWPAEIISHEISNKFLMTDINCPWIPTPKVLVRNNALTFLCDPDLKAGVTYDCKLHYVKTPSKLTADEQSAFGGDLPLSVIYEIINKAALFAIENVESQRVESKASLNNTQE